MWLARLIAPAEEATFLDRWDVSDYAKRLALAWDRGCLGRVEWNPECSNCGLPAPLEEHCRNCGSRDRDIREHREILAARIRDQQHLLEHIERRLPKQ